MTTTPEKKTEAPAEKPKATAAPIDVPRGVPVKLIRFVRSIQVPGYPQTDVVQTQKRPDGAYWELEYIAAMRHHRISFTNKNDQRQTRTVFVHETHVQSWEPLA
jgi:hypothetical protein